MTDLASLHDAVVSAGRAASGFELREWHPGVVVIGCVAFLAIAAAAVALLRGSRSPGRATDFVLGIGCLTALVIPVFLVLFQGVPHAGPLPAAVAARDAACGSFLSVVSSGEVRWMDPGWRRDVESACGSERFALAANAPASRLTGS